MTVKNLNVLITGASGLLGRQVLKYFEDSNLQSKYLVDGIQNFKFNCLGLCHSRVKDKLRPINLNDPNQVNTLVEEFKVNLKKIILNEYYIHKFLISLM